MWKKQVIDEETLMADNQETGENISIIKDEENWFAEYFVADTGHVHEIDIDFEVSPFELSGQEIADQVIANITKQQGSSPQPQEPETKEDDILPEEVRKDKASTKPKAKKTKKVKATKKGKSDEYYEELYCEGGSHQSASIAPMIRGSLKHVKADDIDSLVGKKISNSEDVGDITDEMVHDLKKIVTHGEKKVAFRKCGETGEVFPIGTSDLHQTYYCRSVRENRRKAKNKAARKRRSVERKSEREHMQSDASRIDKMIG